ncbi:hypothetical protein [Hahella sp. HN01]|uniref:hypothetical protein n=1 Tax=Hahella sp. HN01 TaxID=2847262 RepID=UPI001C1F0845|nr:hypothetical protein [Hahella sp. HN01]MBU6950300.1 hypothetical protein [Hahella sp. HN01]
MLVKAVKAIALTSMVFSAGCASILNEDTQKVNVLSTSGEKFSGTIDGVPFEGPGVVEVKRANRDKVIVVDSSDCAKETVMTKSVDPVFFVNVLSGGAFGSTTDYSTEKMWKYQDSITVSCK